jgi:general secretion pathway protein L
MNIAVAQSLQKMRFSYLAPLERQLESFWGWWIAELISLLPSKLQSTLSQRNQRDFVELYDGAFIVRRNTINGNRELARTPLTVAERSDVEFPAGAKEIVLLLPADKVLVRSMTLPLAAEENLREVLSFEMDRETPFSADQVYYDCIVTSRNTSRKTLSVELVLAPRKIVDALLDDLAEFGLRADILSTRDSSGTAMLPINLLSRRKRSNSNKAVDRLNAALTTATVLLFITAISLPLLHKRQLLRELEPQIIEAVAQAESANELRQQVERLVAGSGYLVRKKKTGVSILQTVNEMTRVLPDHTSINRLDISNSEVQLQGQSSSSATLISLLESSPILKNVRFRSPVIRIPSTGEERFHLSAEIEQEQSK